MPKIFISYRREDSKHAVGRLHAVLARHVRNPKRDIFIDIDNIPRGVDFVDHLDGQVAQCDIMLAVIGPSWLTAADAKTGMRRLDDPHDFVRIEVASALKRGIPVVPVVLDDTKIPVAEELPEDLRLLARRNGERLEHESFDADVTRLIKNLPTTDARSRTTDSRVVKPAAIGSFWIAPIVTLVVLTLVGGGAWAWFADPGGWRGTSGLHSVGSQSPAKVSADSQGGPASTPPLPAVSGAPVPPPAAIAPRSNEAAPESSIPHIKFVSGPTLNVIWDHAAFLQADMSPDGSRLVTVEEFTQPRLWDSKTGRELGSLAGCQEEAVLSARFSPDGTRVVTGSSEGSFVCIWDSKSRELLLKIQSGPSRVAVFSHEGSRLFAGDGIWDAKTGLRTATLVRPETNAFDAAFNRDDSRVVAVAWGVTKIWDVSTGKLVTEFKAPESPWGVDFAPDGTQVAVGSHDGTLRIYDVVTGKQLKKLLHNGAIFSVRYSNDGHRILTGTTDGLTRIWDIASGAVIAKAPGGGQTAFAAWSSDETKLVTITDSRAKIYGLTKE